MTEYINEENLNRVSKAISQVINHSKTLKDTFSDIQSESTTAVASDEEETKEERKMMTRSQKKAK
jgi:hypothetical protein